VTSVSDHHARFDVMQETLTRTTLADLAVSDAVNIERAARDGAEIGGHPLSGHVDCVARICDIQTPENNRVLTLAVPSPWIRYVFAKGYIAVNGASLTVASVDRQNSTFSVWLIPETLRMTTFGTKGEGSRVNLEIERSTQVTVDTIRDFLEERLGPLLPRLEQFIEQLENDASLPSSPSDKPPR
jgi:riboflavin synthase